MFSSSQGEGEGVGKGDSTQTETKGLLGHRKIEMKFPAKRNMCPGKKARESTACVKTSSISLSTE